MMTDADRFSRRKNRHAYTTQEAHPSWRQAVTAAGDPRGKRVADVGYGGTYAPAWAQLGAAEVHRASTSRSRWRRRPQSASKGHTLPFSAVMRVDAVMGNEDLRRPR
jgi:hypothetical protein